MTPECPPPPPGDAYIGHAPHQEAPRYAKVEIRPGTYHLVELPARSLGSPGPGVRGAHVQERGRGAARPISAPAARGRLPTSAAAAGGTLPYQVDTVQLAPVRGRMQSSSQDISHSHLKGATRLGGSSFLACLGLLTVF